MKTTLCISLLMALLELSIAAPVVAATDKKIASSTVCQGVSAQDRERLRYNGSSLEAVGGSVSVVCAIIRDSSMSKMNFINVRFKRKDGDTQKLTGVVHSCDGTSGGCSQADARTDDGNLFTSTHVETAHLPHAEDHYFTYRVTLPAGWKLVNIVYQEDA